MLMLADGLMGMSNKNAKQNEAKSSNKSNDIGIKSAAVACISSIDFHIASSRRASSFCECFPCMN